MDNRIVSDKNKLGVLKVGKDEFVTFYPSRDAERSRRFIDEVDAYVDLWMNLCELNYLTSDLEDSWACGRALWEHLRNESPAFDEDEDGELILSEDWLHFKAGDISNEDLWHWFEQTFEACIREWLAGNTHIMAPKTQKGIKRAQESIKRMESEVLSMYRDELSAELHNSIDVQVMQDAKP